jgi:lysophospholipase L1-like esterase
MALRALSVIAAAAALASLACAENIIPASSNAVTYRGRTRVNADGSRSFDWEGVQADLYVTGATYVKLVLNETTAGVISRLKVNVDGYDVATLFVAPATYTSYLLAAGLANNQQHHLNLYNLIEPADENSYGGPLTIVGFATDGTGVPAPAPLSRSMQFIGDSITVGFGAAGVGPCTADILTEDNSITYGALLCANFTANCSTIAWSGKGLFENCCDTGERMPQYFLQTLGGESYSTDWTFSNFVPSAVVINLGTNDFCCGHDTGPAWEAGFSAAYVDFIANITTSYYGNAALPVFAAVGPMSDLYMNATLAAIATANAAGHNVHLLNLLVTPLDGCDGHPGRVGHYNMFAAGQPQIAAVMGW